MSRLVVIIGRGSCVLWLEVTAGLIISSKCPRIKNDNGNTNNVFFLVCEWSRSMSGGTREGRLRDFFFSSSIFFLFLCFFFGSSLLFSSLFVFSLLSFFPYLSSPRLPSPLHRSHPFSFPLIFFYLSFPFFATAQETEAETATETATETSRRRGLLEANRATSSKDQKVSATDS